MILIEWSESALDDLAVILGYIGERNSLALKHCSNASKEPFFPLLTTPTRFPPEESQELATSLRTPTTL
jgi:plasmid stabilization system protein ParE